MCAAVVEHVAVDEEVRAERRRILVMLARRPRRASSSAGWPRCAPRSRPTATATRASSQTCATRSASTTASSSGAARGPAWSPCATSLRARGGDAARPRRASRSRTTSTPSASASRPSGRRSSSCAGRDPAPARPPRSRSPEPLMRYCDFASTHAAHAYVEYQQYMVADADRQRRDLLEHLLAGEHARPRTAAGRRSGPTASPRTRGCWSPPPSPWTRAPTLTRRTSAARRSPAPGCTTPNHARRRAPDRDRRPRSCSGPTPDPVPALRSRRPRSSAGCARRASQLAMGVSTVAAGVAELPRAYQEAHVALAPASVLTAALTRWRG